MSLLLWLMYKFLDKEALKTVTKNNIYNVLIGKCTCKCMKVDYSVHCTKQKCFSCQLHVYVAGNFVFS